MKKILSLLLALAFATAVPAEVLIPWKNLSAIPSPTLTLGGDASGNVTFLNSGGVTLTLTLANTAVSAGTYKSLTVDAKGRVTAGTNPTTLAGYGITDAVPLDATLAALALFNSNGLIVQTAADTFAARTITAPAAGITVTNGNGVSGNPTLVLANDLGAVEALSGTGIATRTATDTWAQRTITAGTGISVTNGDGVAGNPTINNTGVTSVGVIVPAIFSASGSPVTTTGNVTVSLANQAANLVWAGPASGANAPPTFRALTQPDTTAAIAAERNALAPRGGLAFDGTAAGGRANVALTNQTIGTDDFSVNIVFRVPTTNPTAPAAIFALTGNAANNAAANSFECYFANTGGTLIVSLYGTTPGADARTATIAGFVPSYAGKNVMLTVVRSTTTLSIYVNGVSTSFSLSTAGTPPASWQGTLSSTYFALANSASTYPYTGAIYAASLYNVALAQADVTEIYEIGGAVPLRFRWGTQLGQQSNSGFEAFSGTPDDGTGDSFTGWTVQAGDGRVEATQAGAHGGTTAAKITRTALGGNNNCRIHTAGLSNLPVIPGVSYRIRGWTKGDGANDVRMECYATGANSLILAATLAGNTTTSWAQFERTVTVPANGTGIQYTFEAAQVVGAVAQVDDFSAVPLGAVFHFDGDADGLGYQWHDQSTNILDATLTTSGVSWTKPASRGYVRGTLSWVGTHEFKSLLGQRCFPNNYFVEAITVKSTAASTGGGVTLGVVSNNALMVSATAYTTAKKHFGLTNGSTGVGAGVTDNDTNFGADPDTANITASLQIEAHYRTTLGSP